jgi:Domain of unknown function DUF29
VATRIKPTAKDLYEQDFYVWAQDQAELLRDKRFDKLDLTNLIEEVEDLARAMRRSVRKRTITIMVHLLKLEYSPSTDSRLGWRETIRTQRTRLLTDLTPTLSRELAAELAEVFERAPARRRGLAPGSRRAGRRRRAAHDLPLHPRSDHRRLAAVTRPSAGTASKV